MAQLVRKIAKRSGFLLDSYSLVLYGGCGCRQHEPIPPKGEFE
jgi:Fur family ferric uptake transcriptional regulator